MRDLVEFVIDGILQHERAQEQSQRQQQHRASMQRKAPSHAQLHSVGNQVEARIDDKNEQLWKASLQFEAIFVQQMMSAMRKTVHKSDFMPHGFAEDMHASMMDDAIAQASTKHSNFGLASAIYRELENAENRRSQPISAQEISNTADKLKMNNELTMEVSKHAY